MDEAIKLIERVSKRAIEIEQNYGFAVKGVREDAIQRARNSGSLTRFVRDVEFGLSAVSKTRNTALRQLIDEITHLASRFGAHLAIAPLESQWEGHFNYMASLTLERLEQDAHQRVSNAVRDARRIALMSRSMSYNNDWDLSAALLRARESVDKHLSISSDSIGRQQRSERFVALSVRGLAVTMFVDSVVLHAQADRYEVLTYEMDRVSIITPAEYIDLRDELFHPQARRFLRPCR